MLLYYVIYYEQFGNVMQWSDKEALTCNYFISRYELLGWQDKADKSLQKSWWYWKPKKRQTTHTSFSIFAYKGL